MCIDGGHSLCSLVESTYAACKLKVICSRALHPNKQSAQMATRKEFCRCAICNQRLIRLILYTVERRDQHSAEKPVSLLDNS